MSDHQWTNAYPRLVIITRGVYIGPGAKAQVGDIYNIGQLLDAKEEHHETNTLYVEKIRLASYRSRFIPPPTRTYLPP